LVFAEDWARELLVAHAILGGALVAATTHQVVWMRGFVRGDFARLRGVRRFARIGAALYISVFILGNFLYPAYKTRVRAEYLDEGAAVARDWEGRAQTRQSVTRRYESVRKLYPGTPTDSVATEAPPTPANLGYRAQQTARWFDVKEHWVALGAALSLLLVLVLRVWSPREHSSSIAKVVFGLAASVCACAWIGAIIGVVTSSVRAIGGP